MHCTLERHRFDGADVVHLLQSCSSTLDWERLEQRFGEHWPVFLAHLILAWFIYPTDRTSKIKEVLQELLLRLQGVLSASGYEESRGLCRGTFLSLLEYLPAIQEWGYRDARLPPTGRMSVSEIADWTATFEK